MSESFGFIHHMKRQFEYFLQEAAAAAHQMLKIVFLKRLFLSLKDKHRCYLLFMNAEKKTCRVTAAQAIFVKVSTYKPAKNLANRDVYLRP